MADYYDEGYGFVAFTPAWHKKAPVLDFRPHGWTDAAKAAGITWDIETRSIGYLNFPGWVDVEGYKAIIRDDDRSVLSVAKQSYEPITNAEFGEIVEYVYAGADLGIQPYFETLISLRGGRVIAATMVLDERQVHGDPSGMLVYLVAYTSHDGTARCRIGETEVRVVCANTQNAADMSFERTGKFGELTHTSGWRNRLPEVTAQVKRAISMADSNLARYDEMAKETITNEQLHEFIGKYVEAEMRRIYRDRKPDRQLVEASSRKITQSFLSVYDGHLGADTMDGIRGTKWGVYQAVTQMRDHHTRFNGSGDGEYDSLIGRTLLYGDQPKKSAMSILAKL